MTHSDGLGDSAGLLPLSPSEPYEAGRVSLGHTVTSQSSSLAPGSLLPKKHLFPEHRPPAGAAGWKPRVHGILSLPPQPTGTQGASKHLCPRPALPSPGKPQFTWKFCIRACMMHLTLSWPLWVPRSSSPWTQDLSPFHLPPLPLPGLTPPPQGE